MGREHRARVLSALGDPIRLGIVDLLQVQDLSPDALAIALDVPGNLLAHHLRILEKASVVTRSQSQSDKRRTYVHLQPVAMNGLLVSPGYDAPRVVFVCTHNSARSVLAESVWQTISDVPAASAGTHPSDRVNSKAKDAAARAGLTLVASIPNRIEDVLRPDDLVVSVCDSVNEEIGPIPQQRLHWSVPDPSDVGTDAAFDLALSDIGERALHLSPHVRYTRSHAQRRRR